MPRSSFVTRAARLTLVVGGLYGAPLAAQGADTTATLPFRRGQWGAEVDVVSEYSNLGLLRFRSDRSAWLLRVGFYGASERSEYDYADDTLDVERETVDATVSIAAGLRRYRPIAPRAAAYTTVGLTAGGDRYRFEYTDAQGSERWGWNAGAFGELGGTWIVTRNLSLGAAWSVRASYRGSVQDGSGIARARQHGFHIAGGNSNLLATIVF